MKYLVMIFQDESDEALTQELSTPAVMAEYFAYSDMLRATGGDGGSSEALHPSSTASTIKIRNGKMTVTDGPFAESKEQIGGYYLIEAKDLDQAIALAAQCPGAKHGAVEVRPCVDFSQMG
jgi:hypothetical protein